MHTEKSSIFHLSNESVETVHRAKNVLFARCTVSTLSIDEQTNPSSSSYLYPSVPCNTIWALDAVQYLHTQPGLHLHARQPLPHHVHSLVLVNRYKCYSYHLPHAYVTCAVKLESALYSSYHASL